MHELPPLFAPGQRLGRYELLQRLAVGGMAEVYLGSAIGPGDFRKMAAIKRLLPQHALDPQLLRMFLDEARLMARLSHPNIPQVTDVDDGDGGDVPYFVMEYVHGTDLRGILNAAAGPLPLEQALAITGAVAAGLHHAHEHRSSRGQPLEIVHRDVSPSNILVGFAGAVKVTDFGIAKWNEQKSFTLQGQLKGKFAHMSPEQCRGEVLDRRSDVFALGTLLYEMTTGRPPFIAESEYDLLTQIVSRDVAPPRRGGEIYPAQLQQIVLRSLRRDRNDRYASTQQLQLDLEAFAREHRLVVSPVALAGYLEALFGAQVTDWRQALASGKTLAKHLGMPPRPGNGDGAVATERTATDIAALPDGGDPVISTSSGSVPGGAASGGYTSGRPQAKGGTAVPRAVAITAVAGLSLAVLWTATELTSRWQRASQVVPAPSGMSRLGTGDGLAPAATSIPVVPAPGTAAAPASADVSAAGAVVTPTGAARPGQGATPGAIHAVVDLPATRALRTTRRGRELVGTDRERAMRRDLGTNSLRRADPEMSRPGGTPTTVAGRKEAGSTEAGAAQTADVAAPGAAPRTGVALPRPVVPTAPPTKVWDPDSPVPP